MAEDKPSDLSREEAKELIEAAGGRVAMPCYNALTGACAAPPLASET